jgi:hypothetical protein
VDRRTVSTTPSSWWEERKSIQKTVRSVPEHQERYELEIQMRVEDEGENNLVNKIEEREDINEEMKNISQTVDRRTVSTTPSSWWEERKKIEQPNPEDQERHYREEQERYEQERQSPEYNRPAVSKVCDDSYLKLYKSWFESTEALFGKAFELSKNTAPEKFMEFYGDWMKMLQNSFCKFYQIPTLESNKEAYDMWIKLYGKNWF